MIKCYNCGAPMSAGSVKCDYCGTILHNVEDFSKLEPSQFASYLKDHITKARDKFDSQIFSYLLFFLAVWLGAGYFLYQNLTMLWFVLAELSLGGVLFVLWGLIIIRYESKAVDQVFQTELAPMIQSYLLQRKISKQELYLSLKDKEIDSKILEIVQRV